MLDTEPDIDAGISPEQRLMIALVISAVDEYQEWCARISNSWHTSNRPVNPDYKFSLKQIRRQCRSEWFQDICAMAEFSLERVLRKFDALDREYSVNQIPFQDEPERFMSQWALRKLARRRVI